MARDKAYLAAEQKIQQALQSGATKLDLRNMKLTELPESIGQLTQLTNLDLSSNQLTTLPDSLGQLTQLRELRLYGNKLTILPETLGKLSQLKVLWESPEAGGNWGYGAGKARPIPPYLSIHPGNSQSPTFQRYYK